MHRKYFFKTEPQRDRRTSCRYNVDRECRLRYGDHVQPALLLDVSSTGARVVNRQRLAPKTRVLLEIADCQLAGEVQNVSTRGLLKRVYVTGIRLLEVWPEKLFAELLRDRKPS